MAKINNRTYYPEQRPSINDSFLGTDGDDPNLDTVSFSVKDVVDLFIEGLEIDGIIQNNIVIEKNLGYSSDTILNVADAVNALEEFEIGETQIYIFHFSERTIQPTDSSQLSNSTLTITKHSYLFKKGKGIYGTSVINPTESVDIDDFYELKSSTTELPSSTDQEPILYYIPNYNREHYIDAINNHGTFGIINGKDTYFEVNQDIFSPISHTGRSPIYRFIGAEGTYGSGATLITENNLIPLNDTGINTDGTNNITIIESVPVLIPNGTSISDAFNNLPFFRITQNQLYIFNTISEIIENNIGYIQKSSYFLKKGKGKYGQGSGVITTDSDFKLNYKEKKISLAAPNGPIYYNFDKSSKTTLLEDINTSENPIIKDSLKTTVLEKNGIMVSLIGADGQYGEGLLQAAPSDLKILEEQKTDIDIDLLESNIIESTLDYIRNNDMFFDKSATFSDKIILNNVDALPQNPEIGTLVRYGKALMFYDGGSWLTLNPTNS